jgi:hypothetical protein
VKRMPTAIDGSAARMARQIAIQILYDAGFVGHNFMPDETLFENAKFAYMRIRKDLTNGTN